jgi:hypothetical protein
MDKSKKLKNIYEIMQLEGLYIIYSILHYYR